MITKTIKGDLIKLAKEGKFDAIVHGCNIFNCMGAGIAKQIKREFPEAYEADQTTKKGDRSKLGTFTMAITNHMGTHVNLAVLNAYTQHTYWKPNPVDYNAIRKVFTDINFRFSGDEIGIPKIGAGLAGGDWDLIAEIINDATPDLNITLVEYDG